jgi:secondary thiamine-phosphate synthase enzyme
MLTVDTHGPEFVDITANVTAFLHHASGDAGMLSLFVRHTSASLTIQENADPDVLTDLRTALDRLAPDDGGWRHRSEGPDDMPAHIKSMLTSSNLLIPVTNGRLALGTWQAVYLVEHRKLPHRRELVLQFTGTVR